MLNKRRKRSVWLMWMVVGTFLLALLAAAPACREVPFGTIIVEDEAGQKIGLAWDKNPLDGVADIDPVTGEYDLVLPKQAYAVAQQVDEIAPMLLKGAGSLLGISLLTLLGVFWKNRKLGRFSIGVVEAVQVGRQAMVDGGFANVLKVFDKALGGAQTGATRVKVAELKAKNAVASVTTTPADE